MEKSEIISHTIRYSVIVPTYNSAGTLTRCLTSLMQQSIPKNEYEVIVVDDGSTDDTAEVAARFDVKYVAEVNQGPAAARNFGVQHATGEILLFTDADCIPDEHWMERMLDPFKNDPEVTGVKGTYKTRQREIIARFAQAEFEDRYDLLRRSPTIDMIDTYSAAYRKDVFLKMGGFDPRFPVANNEDTDLSYRIASAGYKLVFQPHAFVYHTHQPVFLNYFKLKFWRGYWRMVVYRRHPDKAFKDSYTPAVLKIQTLLMALSLVLIPIILPFPRLVVVLLALWGIILVSSFPFSIKTYQTDKIVGILSPLIVFFRSLVFATGSVCGVLRSFRKR